MTNPTTGSDHPTHLRPNQQDAAPSHAEGRQPDVVEQEAAHESTPSEPVEVDEARLGRNTALMSALVIVSRITGFFRTWGQAMALGVTVTASCYTVANNLPNQLYELVMGGMLVTAFLPVYLSVKKRLGREGANEYTSNLVSIIIMIMGAVTVLSMVFAYQVVWTQSFGANADFDQDLAVYFFRFFAIEVVLYALSTIVSGVLNAERDYLWSTAAPIFNNFVTTASFLLYAALVGSAPQLALLILAIGNPLGVAVQVLVQLPSLRRHGIRIRPHIDWRDPALKETVSIGVPSIIVMLMTFATVSVQTSSALSVTAKGASVSYYARLWYTLPYAILAVPITTAMFTELSVAVAADDMRSFVSGLAKGMSRIVFLLIPFMLYLIVFAPALIGILGGRSLQAEDMQMTVEFLQFLSIALPFYGICSYLQKACSSLRRMGLYAGSTVVASVAQILVCLVLTPIFGLNLVALSTVVCYVVVDIVTLLVLRRRLGSIGIRRVLVGSLRGAAVGAAGAAVGWAILWALTTFVGPMDGSVIRSLIYVVAGGLPALAVTFGLALALRMDEVEFVRGVLLKIRR